VAGTGGAGDSGDGAAATLAKLDEPSSIFKDVSGDLYIADTKNHKIRKVDTSGEITTVAGTGDSGDSGDGGAATSARLKLPEDIFVDKNGNIFIADRDAKKIRIVNAQNGNIYTLAGTGDPGDTTDLPANLIQFIDPGGITMASDYGASRIYISDTGNHKIKVLLLKSVYGL
jgi:hypothetical protein